jgi:hypothetical protein
MTWSAAAERVGAKDLFILKRIGEDRLFNIGGYGRGEGWAGNVSANPEDEALLHEALESGVARRVSGVPFRAFGPYWARDVAAMGVNGSVVVAAGDGVTAKPDEVLRATAEDALAPSGDVPEAKKDADELEVKQAVASISSVPRDSLEEAARGIAANAARALSCEFAAVLLTESPVRLFVADEGWRPPATEDEIIAALLPLSNAVANGMLVEQDLSISTFPYRPLGFEDGLVARCVVPLGEDGSLGMLVTAHAGSSPRGFTSLCQRVASEMGAEAESVLTTLRT